MRVRARLNIIQILLSLSINILNDRFLKGYTHESSPFNAVTPNLSLLDDGGNRFSVYLTYHLKLKIRNTLIASAY